MSDEQFSEEKEGIKEGQPRSVENLSPAENREFEKRQEKLNRKLGEIQKRPVEELATEEQEEIQNIKKEAQKASGIGSVASIDGTAQRLLETVIEGEKKLDYALHAAQEMDPRSFDRFIDLLRSPETLKKLEERGDIQ